MRDDLTSMVFPVHGEPIDPVAMARKDMQKKLPKKFYAEAKTEARDSAHVLLLDGRAAKTPARNPVQVTDERLAQLLAQEWNAQVEVINPLDMPLTRLIHSAADGVAREADAVRAEILRYAGSDLVCYRAAQPEALVRAQTQAWDPVLAFAEARFGAKFTVISGVMHVEQPEAAKAAVAQALSAYHEPLELAALSVLTSISGSALIALGVAHGVLDGQSGFAAGHVDEEFQIRVWGADEEAARRHAFRKRDFETAALALRPERIA